MRPGATFEIVAIKATRGGDPAEADAVGEQVARTLVAAGGKVRRSGDVSIFLPANEVHVFLH